MHRVPALWEFHKVHHSAEVLTPLTEWRQHPVELMLFPVVIGAATAAVRVPMLHAFGPRAQLIDGTSLRHRIRLHHPPLAPQRAAVLRHRLARPADPVARPPSVAPSTRPEHHDRNLGFACRCGTRCSGPCPARARRALCLWPWRGGTRAAHGDWEPGGAVHPRRSRNHSFFSGSQPRTMTLA